MKNRDRKPNRLRNYDYSQAGYYFVTICTLNRQQLFGEIIDRRMVTNDAGKMVERTWNELPKFYRGIQIDQFQIMPNHVHGIIVIIGKVGTGPHNDPRINTVGTGSVGTGPRACPDAIGLDDGQPRGVVRTGTGSLEVPARLSVPTMSLSDIVHRFKSFTTHKYMAGVKSDGWKAFDGKLWQRSFYDHIIRNEKSLDNIRAYIQNNPLRWELDASNSRKWMKAND